MPRTRTGACSSELRIAMPTTCRALLGTLEAGSKLKSHVQSSATPGAGYEDGCVNADALVARKAQGT